MRILVDHRHQYVREIAAASYGCGYDDNNQVRDVYIQTERSQSASYNDRREVYFYDMAQISAEHAIKDAQQRVDSLLKNGYSDFADLIHESKYDYDNHTTEAC